MGADNLRQKLSDAASLRRTHSLTCTDVSSQRYRTDTCLVRDEEGCRFNPVADDSGGLTESRDIGRGVVGGRDDAGDVVNSWLLSQWVACSQRVFVVLGLKGDNCRLADGPGHRPRGFKKEQQALEVRYERDCHEGVDAVLHGRETRARDGYLSVPVDLP
jgi:hypothetical protein